MEDQTASITHSKWWGCNWIRAHALILGIDNVLSLLACIFHKCTAEPQDSVEYEGNHMNALTLHKVWKEGKLNLITYCIYSVITEELLNSGCVTPPLWSLIISSVKWRWSILLFTLRYFEAKWDHTYIHFLAKEYKLLSGPVLLTTGIQLHWHQVL